MNGKSLEAEEIDLVEFLSYPNRHQWRKVRDFFTNDDKPYSPRRVKAVRAWQPESIPTSESWTDSEWLKYLEDAEKLAFKKKDGCNKSAFNYRGTPKAIMNFKRGIRYGV